MKKKEILAELKKMLRECGLTDDMKQNRLTSQSYKLYDMLETFILKLQNKVDLKNGVVFDFNNIKQVKSESGYDRPAWDIQSAHEKVKEFNKQYDASLQDSKITLDYEVIYDELQKVKANRIKKIKQALRS